MQVSPHTWRNLYDLKQLGADIEYNGNAGAEILVYYLTRFALKKRGQTTGRRPRARDLLGLQWRPRPAEPLPGG